MTPLGRLAFLAVVAACARAQYAEERAPRYIASDPKPTPVPILKQINRHNEDGSYTYGYEAADGSFKIETKSPAGDVKGKYGYKDDTGKLRVVEYGADKFGFQPAGEGITVAPPTLVDESTRDEGLRPGKSQQNGGRSQYRAPAPIQSGDYDYDEPAQRPQPRPQPQPQYRPAPTAPPRPPPPPPQQQQQQYQPTPQQQYRPQPPQQQYRPSPQQSAPVPPKPQFFSGAAASPADDGFFNPEPASRQFKPKQEQFQPSPQYQQFSGNQDFAPSPPQPRYTQNQVPQQRNTHSMLDQLLKEYALPQGGSAPLHDITFGSY